MRIMHLLTIMLVIMTASVFATENQKLQKNAAESQTQLECDHGENGNADACKQIDAEAGDKAMLKDKDQSENYGMVLNRGHDRNVPSKDIEPDNSMAWHEGQSTGTSSGKRNVKMAVGGMMAGFGTLLVLHSVYLFNSPVHNSDRESRDATAEAFSTATLQFGLAALELIIGVPMVLVGVPILISNSTQYSIKNESDDEYQMALERQGATKKTVTVSIIPTVNFDKAGGGINALLNF